MQEKLGLTDTLSTADRAFDRLGIGRETLAIKNFDKPLIAAVNGAAAGGGFALAMLHDIRLASERATFTSAFVRIGLVAEMGLPLHAAACDRTRGRDGRDVHRSFRDRRRSACDRADRTRDPTRALIGRGDDLRRADRSATPDRRAVREAGIGAITRQRTARPTRTRVVLPGRRLRHRRCTRRHRRLPRAASHRASSGS